MFRNILFLGKEYFEIFFSRKKNIMKYSCPKKECFEKNCQKKELAEMLFFKQIIIKNKTVYNNT